MISDRASDLRGRYWDRTSDLFGVKQSKQSTHLQVSAGQDHISVRSRPLESGHIRTRSHAVSHADDDHAAASTSAIPANYWPASEPAPTRRDHPGRYPSSASADHLKGGPAGAGTARRRQSEQDCDIAILLHRPDAFDRDDPRAGEADVIRPNIGMVRPPRQPWLINCTTADS
jgi:replicative DNA helicase